MSLPQLLTAADVASLMRNRDGTPWPTWKARRWLRKTGAAELRGGRWVTTLERLIARFPEAFEALVTRDVPEPEETTCPHCAELEQQLEDLARRLVKATQENAERRKRTF
jgi:hypothetical protein